MAYITRDKTNGKGNGRTKINEIQNADKHKADKYV